MRRNKTETNLPPHDDGAERGALGCVMITSPADQDAMLLELRPAMFYDLRHRELFKVFTAMRMDGRPIDLITLNAWLKAKELEKAVGGIAYAASHPEQTPSAANFSYYLDILKEKALRRWTLDKRQRLADLAGAEQLTPEQLREEFAEIYERAASIGNKQPLLEIITPGQARAFKPDPADFLVGEGLIMRGLVVTIGGEPGVGKSRLATTLAVAGARGNNRWQGYEVKNKWRTLILQTENTGNRLKEEFNAVPVALDDQIRVSKTLPRGMAFGDPEFRRELARFFDSWPFQMLVIDPWNDVSAEDGQTDYKEAFANIRRTFQGRAMPAVIIVAHLRKPRAEHGQRRKTGRELLHELSGSLALGSTSRTVFVVQAASNRMDDDRLVFEIAKANDCDPAWLREAGTRSAWHRQNGAFAPCHDFDWQNWDNPETATERRAITLEMLGQVLNGKPEKLSTIAGKLEAQFEVGFSTAMRALGKGGYLAGALEEEFKGLFRLKK